MLGVEAVMEVEVVVEVEVEVEVEAAVQFDVTSGATLAVQQSGQAGQGGARTVLTDQRAEVHRPEHRGGDLH
jgi:hypothetical protein